MPDLVLPLSLSPFAATDASAFGSGLEFFASGGFFMVLLLITSVIAVMAIVFKFLTLRRERIIPPGLEREIERFEDHLDEGAATSVNEEIRAGRSALARLCGVALAHPGRPQAEAQEAVQASAREEIVKLNSGIPVLDVVITIAPLLGLLGTASGLVVVFADLGTSADHANIARGIARALNTTIVGLAVAVPAVVAHSFFSRKIEMMAARLEVLLGRVISVCHRRGFFEGAER